MENLITVQMVEQNKDSLKRLFTELQISILKKRLEHIPLNSNEKTYYYRFIKPKMKAMLVFFNISEINIHGKEYMIPKRIPKAIQLLSKLEKKHKNKKIIISGSFLFSKNYNDIDAFIFTRYNKEDYKKGRLHVSFLPESAIDSLFFSSLQQISISNFTHIPKKDFEITLKDLLQTYELLINELLHKEDCGKALRDFLLQTEYISRGVILNSEQLYHFRKISENRKLSEILSQTFINAIALVYKKEILQQELQKQIDSYKELSKQYPSAENTAIYISTYEQAMALAE